MSLQTTSGADEVAEHLGLLPPDLPGVDGAPSPTPAMQPAPAPQADDTGSASDALVADPLADETIKLWDDTAATNRAVYDAVFKPVPADAVRDWKSYAVSASLPVRDARVLMEGVQAYVPNIKHGHVAPGVSLATAKTQLARVRGSLLDMPLVRAHLQSIVRDANSDAQNFLIDQKDFADNLTWSGLDPLLPIYT
jgi:phospholipase D1/2